MNRKQRRADKKLGPTAASHGSAASPILHGMIADAVRHHQAGHLNDAERLYREILRLDSGQVDALHGLGLLAHQVGRHDVAADLIGKAIARNGSVADLHTNLGSVLHALGRLDDAIASYRQALFLRPDSAEAHNNLGLAFQKQGGLIEATASFERAVSRRPHYADAHYNLGSALLELGALEGAVASFERALSHQPHHAHAEMTLIFAQLYRPGVRLAEILARARRWNESHAARFSWPAHRRAATTNQAPRVGFVSADFRDHVVGHLAAPAIEGLGRAGFHVTCYSNGMDSDAMTGRFVAASARWRPIAGQSDDAVAAMIRADGIDILIDLSGYTADNRLAVFARKPAPLQVAGWLGYPATSGLAAMDYVLADRHQVPAGAETFYSEAVVRLPDSYAVFEPPSDAPPVNGPPALTRGGVTFGSFNVLKKITPDVIAVWSRILARVPGSRLLMKAKAFNFSEVQRRCAEEFARNGIAAERLQFVGGTSSAHHRAWMGQADIALDPFPYSGGQTTLESLWMGLPVITLPGETFASRHTLGYLSTIGLGEWAASDSEHYVAIAVDLASDPARLAALRAGLRARLLASPLCDVERFSAALAVALRTMWSRWCSGEAATSFDIRLDDEGITSVASRS